MKDVTLESLREGSILTFDKPMYWTSFDLVNKVRRVITLASGGKKVKVGHAGTLDPLATGLMIVCTGRETKRIALMTDLDKEYIAVFRLGSTTPSHDLETETDATYPTEHITEEMIGSVIAGMHGEQVQVPPVFSAKLIDGKRAYELARMGIMKEPKPVKVMIREMELLGINSNDVTVRVLCSKGTYIRSLARDFGIALGSGAHLVSLTRTMIGEYRLGDAVTPENFEKFVILLKQSASESV
ncbi:MAG: tRNA pseudouridine(55) synthase TruB [Bacteroidales bacterium]|jgi:tRNA pseudouridine55 synthase|nr:tRNA pseudouridine(55) synthase TruB [Bacteroidales bacterium]